MKTERMKYKEIAIELAGRKVYCDFMVVNVSKPIEPEMFFDQWLNDVFKEHTDIFKKEVWFTFIKYMNINRRRING